MTVEISRSLLDRLVAEAAANRHEICGLLLGSPGRIADAVACANVAADPARSFELDPQALLAAHRAARAGGARIAGHYHSHPSGRAEPSDRDRAMAYGDGALWLILADGAARLWVSDRPGELTPATLLACARPGGSSKNARFE